jgi:UDP-glucose 4-epimerase
MVIPRFVHAALAGRLLEIHGDGTQTRCFCHVADTVRALRSVMELPSASGEIYNVGSQERIRILDLAERIIGATASKSEIVFVPYEQVYGQGIEDMLHRIPSIDKVRHATGWEPSRSLDEIIAHVVEHARSAPVLADHV